MRPTPEQIANTKCCNAVLGGYERTDGGTPVPVRCTRKLGHASFNDASGRTYTHSDQSNGNSIDWDESGSTIRYDHEPRPMREVAASPKVVYSSRQKREIRGHYPHWRLRFRPDGSVEAQKAKGGAWGVLYTPEQAKSHLKAKGLWKPVYGLEAGRSVTIDGKPVFHLSWSQARPDERYPIPPAELDALAHHIVKLLNQNPHQFM